ncbi:hypothetical protein HFP89_08015 [Wenzhouxiangella sp. XN79A]|uniref:hypothetical protein n=1 Tax=Wenzhouxiangella sp. XN79A TaxID=2724193 RepID=UPI00144A78A1|nr:hypothetical protein [Wenzhouxiangella sp. XN79A]NKI35109.1 hypothetical protein [Wenzhouxiangella sp. XN79A]
MTATVVEIPHARDPVLFHCPLTGLPVCGDVEQSFEGGISPFLLFAITETGEVYARSDKLPEPAASALQRSIDAITSVLHRLDAVMTTEDLESFVPSVLTPLLPDSALLFEVRTTCAAQRSPDAFRICMDFTLPACAAAVDHVATIEQPE